MISEELILDASAADQTIAQIDQQLQQAAELFKVALADALTILAQPVIAAVEADTQLAQTEIAALADAPPVNVLVAADTDPAKVDISALETEIPTIDVPVDADTSGAVEQISSLSTAESGASEEAKNLEGSLAGLGAVIGVTEGSAKELVSTLGEMGGEAGGGAAKGVLALGAATAGFFEEGLNAVSAGQRFDLVLGDMAGKAREIDVNGLNTSIEELGIRFGSTGAEMENATASLFQFAVNAGASKDKAAEFAAQVETLAARAISLNPSLGTLADVTESLGPKLARGGRFAANFGLALTPAEIAARALRDTGKSLSSELTVQEKAMAGAEIASERYGASLAGTVAEGEKNAAIQAESLKARFKEAIEQIGVPIVSPVLDLLTKAEPQAVLIAQDLGLLAGDVLPLVSAALDVVAIPLKVIDAIIGNLPAPLITAAAAFWAVSFALEALAASEVVASIAGEGLALSIEAFTPELAIAAAALVLITSAFGSSKPFIDDVTKAIDTGARGFDDYGTAVRKVIENEVEAAAKAENFGRRLNDAGVSTQDLSDALIKGGDAFGQYEGRIISAARANGANEGTVIKLILELQHLQDATEKAALKALENAVATGQITDAERTEAEAKAGQIDGHVNWAAALDIVQPKIKSATDAAAEQARAEEEAAKKADELKKAYDGLATAAPFVAFSIDAINNSTGPTAESLLGLASNIDAAHLSSTQMEAVALSLGVSVDSLKGFVDDARKALDDFVQTAEKNLPDVSAAIDAVLNPKSKPDKPIIIDPAKLQAEIDADLEKIATFNTQLANLHAFGLDNLARVAAEKGPEFTAALSKAIAEGDTAQVLNAKFGELNAATIAEGPILRESGSGIIAATGEIGRLASEDFQGKLNMVAPTQAQLEQARTAAKLGGIPFSEALQAVAGDAAVAYETSIGAIRGSTEAAVTDAADSIDSHGNLVKTAGSNAGAGAAKSFAEGIAPVPESAGTIFRNATDAIALATPALALVAQVGGRAVGQAFDTGLAAGIDLYISGVEAAARRAIDAAVSAAKIRAGVSSPSKVMKEIGGQMAQGLALGLDESADLVDASARRMMALVLEASKVGAPEGNTDWKSLTVPGATYGYGPGMPAGMGSLIGQVHIHLDAAASADPALAARAGKAAAGAFVDRVTPLAGRRLLVGTTIL